MSHYRPLLVVAALLLAALPGCGGEKPAPREQTLQGLQARFGSRPDPPAVGHDNTFTLALAERGQPLSGARVTGRFFFKGLNREGPTASFLERAPGTYEAPEVSTGMKGKWEATITVSRDAQPDATFVFPFTVGG
jgi:hypothetical protein